MTPEEALEYSSEAATQIVANASLATNRHSCQMPLTPADHLTPTKLRSIWFSFIATGAEMIRDSEDRIKPEVLVSMPTLQWMKSMPEFQKEPGFSLFTFIPAPMPKWFWTGCGWELGDGSFEDLCIMNLRPGHRWRIRIKRFAV